MSSLIGYTRCFADARDIAAQKEVLLTLGVAARRIYADHGLSETDRARPCLEQALAAVRRGDTLVVPKLDRLARSAREIYAIGRALMRRGGRLQIGATVHDPNNAAGRQFFDMLATFAEFEADLIKLQARTRRTSPLVKAKPPGKKPKLSDRQQTGLRRMYSSGHYSISDLSRLFAISRSTVFRTLGRP